MRTAAGRNPKDLGTSIFRFIPKEPQKLCPTLISYVFRKKSPGQPFDVEVLDCDHSITRDQPSAQVVGVILADVPDPLVKPAYQQAGPSDGAAIPLTFVKHAAEPRGADGMRL